MSPKRQPTRYFWLTGLVFVVLASCTTRSAGQGLLGGLPSFSSWTDEERAWSDLLRNSSVKQVSDDRLVVDAWGAPGTDMEAVEFRLLSRAAAEVRALGSENFIIVHVRDRNLPVAGGLNSFSIFGADEYEIGNYEDLVRSRYERDYGAAPRAWWNPGLSAIVVPLSETEASEHKSTFDAVSLYEYLNRHKMAKGSSQ